MERMTAIDTALIKGNNGCRFLEMTRPTKKDLKEASDQFKDAADLLKASLTLLDHDCYQVQEAPVQPGTPLFNGAGQPSSLVPVSAEEREAFENLEQEDQDALWHETLARARSIFLGQPDRTAEDWIPVSKRWIAAMGNWGNGEDVDCWAALEDLLRAGDTAFVIPHTCPEQVEGEDGEESRICGVGLFGAEVIERGMCRSCHYNKERRERDEARKAKASEAKGDKPKKPRAKKIASAAPDSAPDPLENEASA